jgi:hypothetical protein
VDFLPDHRSEEVFHSHGEHHLGVGLELGQVDDFVGFEGLPGDFHPLEDGSLRHGKGDRVVKLDAGYAQFPGDVLHAGLRTHGGETVEARAVSDEGMSPRCLYPEGRSPDHFGVSGDASFRRRGGEEIGLQEHTLPGADKPFHSPQGLQELPHAVLHFIPFIGSAPKERRGRHVSHE